jgi:hypothetical protein
MMGGPFCSQRPRMALRSISALTIPKGERRKPPYPQRPLSAGCLGASPPHKPEAVIIRLPDPKPFNQASITTCRYEPDVVNERKSVYARFIGNWLSSYRVIDTNYENSVLR